MNTQKIIDLATQIAAIEGDLERINTLIDHRNNRHILNDKIASPYTISGTYSVFDTDEYNGFAPLSAASNAAITTFYLSYEKIKRVLEDQLGFLRGQLRSLVNAPQNLDNAK